MTADRCGECGAPPVVRQGLRGILHGADCLRGATGKAYTVFVRAYPIGHARTLARAVRLVREGDEERFIRPVRPDDLRLVAIVETERRYPYRVRRRIPLERAVALIDLASTEGGN